MLPSQILNENFNPSPTGALPEPLFSLVIALYNDGSRLEKNYPLIADFLNKMKLPWELILVDDGSTDTTHHLLTKIAQNNDPIRLVQLKSNRGQGAALKAGMLLTRGRIVAYTDSDLSTPLACFEKLIQAIVTGADIAIGSRWLQGSHIRIQQPFLRRELGKLYYRFIHLIFSVSVSDTNCGFKAYRREAAHLLFGMVRSWRWVFNLEHLMLASRFGFTIQEIPVEWQYDPNTKVRLYRDVLFTLWEAFFLQLRLLIKIYPDVNLLKKSSGRPLHPPVL